MASKENLNLDNDQSFANNKIQLNFKNGFYMVINRLLIEDEQSLFITVLALLIQLFQLTTLPFNNHIHSTWQNSETSDAIKQFTQYFLFSPYFRSLDYYAFVILLYVQVTIIVISMMLFFFITYSFSRSKSSFVWPVLLLKIIIAAYNTIFFIPFMDLFLQTFNCDGYTHLKFNDVQCWTNTHIVHGIISILFIIIFYFIMIILSLVYYEGRLITNDLSSRFSGRSLAFFYTYQLIVLISNQFIKTDYIIIAIMFLGSYITFYKLHIQNPFNNIFISKLQSMIVSIHFETILLLTFAYFLEENLLHGIIYAWLSSIPLIIFIIIKKQQYKFELIVANDHFMMQPEMIIQQCQHLLKLYKQSSTDEQSSLLINGFLEIHRATCLNDDCYLKIKKSSNQRQSKNQMKETDQDLLMVLSQIYFYATKRFPNEAILKIHYSLFLMDYLKQNQQALNELHQAEQLNPTLDLDFQIFRYKRIIEDRMNNSQESGNLDSSIEASYQTILRTFQTKIERATLMHMDFWSQLQEDNPDLGKLNEIGAKINYAIQQVESQWQKLQKMRSHLNKSMRLYGNFIIAVLQDLEYGEQILKRARDLQIENNKIRNVNVINVQNQDELQMESLPTMLISINQEKSNQIINLNASCCNLLGYNKSELMNRKINVLIPNLVQKYHDQYIDYFLKQNQQDSKVLNKERSILVKCKSGYIQQVYINLKMLPNSMDENSQVIAQFKQIKSFKSACYIITDHEYTIDSISAGCISLLYLDAKSIFSNNYKFTDLFPDFDQIKDLFYGKSGSTITYSYFSSQEQLAIKNSKDNLNQINELQEEIPDSIVFSCWVSEIYSQNEQNPKGYLIKLEQFKNDVSMQQSLEVIKFKGQSAITNFFQFRYQDKMYQGEFSNSNSQSVKIDQTIMWDQQDLQSSILSGTPFSQEGQQKTYQNQSQEIEQKEMVDKINYGEGIKTVRLFDGRIQDIEEYKDDAEDEEEVQQNSSVFANNQDQIDDYEISISEFNTVFKSRRNLGRVLNSYETPRVINSLKYIVNIIMIILIILAFVDYFLKTDQFSKIITHIQLVQESNMRTAEMQSVLTIVQNLKMLNKNIFIEYNTEESIKKYEQEQKIQIEERISKIDQLHKKLVQEDLDYEKLTTLLQGDAVEMKFWNGKSVKYDLNEATQQIISKTLNIKNEKLQNIHQFNPDVFFIEHNLLNHYYQALVQSSNYYIEGLIKNLKIQQQSFLIILIISAVSLFLACLVFVPAILQVNRTQLTILSLFLDIPEKAVKYLYNKCESYISNLQQGEDDEIASEMQELEKQEEDELSRSLMAKNKKKKFKITNRSSQNYIIIFLIVTAIIQVYFVFNYLIGETVLSDTLQLIPEYNLTAFAEQFYRFSDNVERQMYFNRSLKSLSKDTYDIVNQNQEILYYIDSQIHQEHSINVVILNQIYQNAFNTILMTDPCSIFYKDVNVQSQEECQAWADGSIGQGMAVGLSRYFENIRYMRTIYEQFYDKPDANFTKIANGFGQEKQIVDDPIYNRILNLNNFNLSTENRITQTYYVKATFRYLVEMFIQGLKDDYNLSQTQRLALFIVFNILLFILYFFLWLSLQMKMTREIWRTQSMIIMIPLPVIKKQLMINEQYLFSIRSIKMFIKNQMHSQVNE